MNSGKHPFKIFSDVFYEKNPDKNNLRQGDLINLKDFKEEYEKLDEENSLVDLYPYFFNNYDYAVISTQCCDISNDNSKFKVRCIQMLAAKPFATVLNEWAEEQGVANGEDENGFKILKQNNKFKSNFPRQMKDLLNHNTKLHFFYPYHEDIDQYLIACADIPISLRIETIYKALLKSRVLSITTDYRHKLALCLSTLYGRFGLDEFAQVTNMSKVELENLFAEFISGLGFTLKQN